ncbi:MmgE/PrpD family protein [Nocardia vinacea]|uniref:MmgE/PrpD family protein n=1 Tax=Nocardia vinacea TaxID=96468 RepID=A0ABZ1YRJ3_9NOCA|nr:MmgE/PrpD family protein [Nocardia vinacea]
MTAADLRGVTAAEPGIATAATATLADWIHEMCSAAMPSEVAHQVRRLVIDYLAAAVVGAGTEVAQGVRAVVAQMYPGDRARIIGGGRASAAGAALANGTAAHALDIDDGYTPGSVHPSAATLPAIFAVADQADPDTLVRAIATAVEVTCRIARAGHPATREAGFHNTALAGVLGAAAGVSVVLGSDRETIASALGVAASHAGGLFEFLGSGAEVKRLHAGKAARDGLLSAYLARHGVSGPATALEGHDGYFHAFAGDRWRPADLLDGLGQQWALRDTYVKVYPCCRHLHSAVDAVLELRASHDIDPARVTEIRVETYAVAAAHAHTRTDSLIDAQMSMPYAIAASLLNGQLGLTEFTAAQRNRHDAAALASRVRIGTDPALDDRYPRERPARVTISRSGLPDLCREVAQPRGEPARPLTDAELEAKFHVLAGPILGERRAARTVAAAWSFEDPDMMLADLADRHEGDDR